MKSNFFCEHTNHWMDRNSSVSKTSKIWPKSIFEPFFHRHNIKAEPGDQIKCNQLKFFY